MLRKLIQIVLICSIISLVLASTCGGNCRAGNCPSCPCGSQVSATNISIDCGSYIWERECCRCIVSSISGGNKHHTAYSNNLFMLGLLQIDQVTALKFCNIDIKTNIDLCYYGPNAGCGYVIYYQSNRKWDYWGSYALKCGCPVSDQFKAKHALIKNTQKLE